ncbi:MAG: trehalase family glycosidase [Candidatus Saccharimonadales bacterium]
MARELTTKIKTRTGDDLLLRLPPRLNQASVERAMGYIEAKWGQLETACPTDTETLIGVPHPYFTPGSKPRNGFIHKEMYYWDTYFIALSLLGTSREHQAYEQADNLLHLLKRFGMVPTGNRLYLTSRSQPPLLSSLLLDLYDHDGSKEWLAPRIELAKLEYRNVWRGREQPHWRDVFHGLSRNYEINVLNDLAECESGWDYTTRFHGRALDYTPIDLNALLFKCESDFARAALILGKPQEAEQWQELAQERRKTVDKYLWNPKAGFYFDHNYQTGRHSNVWSLAAYYALWSGMASAEQAAHLAAHIEKFEEYGGLATTLEYPHVAEHQPAQWSHPNGWAPLHLLTIRGLARYGYEELAARIAHRWLHNNLQGFINSGEFFEKYNVVDIAVPPKDGVYPNQVGFGWTNAVFAQLVRDYRTTLL